MVDFRFATVPRPEPLRVSGGPLGFASRATEIQSKGDRCKLIKDDVKIKGT